MGKLADQWKTGQSVAKHIIEARKQKTNPGVVPCLVGRLQGKGGLLGLSGLQVGFAVFDSEQVLTKPVMLCGEIMCFLPCWAGCSKVWAGLLYGCTCREGFALTVGNRGRPVHT